jgi:hypothetical protein
VREVVVRWQKTERHSSTQERFAAVLATGLQRLFEQRAGAVDFDADESVTTTCPHDGDGEDRKT